MKNKVLAERYPEAMPITLSDVMLPTPSELTELVDVTRIRNWVRLDSVAWGAVCKVLGEPKLVRQVGSIPREVWDDALGPRGSLVLVTTPGAGDEEDQTRGPTPV